MNRTGHDSTASARRERQPPNRPNPVVMLTILLPLFAVGASVGTAIVAYSRGDATLPDEYHWEGDKLDHDFARSDRAAALKIDAYLSLQPREGECRINLELDGSPPRALDVRLIHVSQPALDRQIRFWRSGNTTSYSAACPPTPAALWHVELSDIDGSWSFRDDASGNLAKLHLSAVAHGNDVAWR